MIVPMKKISLIILESEKKKALKRLRKFGVVHIEETEGSGAALSSLKEKAASLENCIFTLSENAKKDTAQKEQTLEEALLLAEKIAKLTEEKRALASRKAAFSAEAERLKAWGEINPEDLALIKSKGIDLTLYEMSAKEYDKADISAKTLVLTKTKSAVRFLIVANESESSHDLSPLESYKVEIPEISTTQIEAYIADAVTQAEAIDEEIKNSSCYIESLKNAVEQLKKDIEFETYSTGMGRESLSEKDESNTAIAYLTGYAPEESTQALRETAKKNAWGLIIENPTEEDNVPTQLKNNKLVSLIYPLTDFLGTVPGYFEYDISGWFLGFILIFFGIIFGDGGYGLLICAVAGILIIKNLKSKKEIPPAFLLILLLGGATVLWGTLTCTWFGLTPQQLPQWLKAVSLPFISNVYADKIWYPFWTNGEAGLTTAQNLQIFCFSLALVQLTVAHIMGAIRNRKSLKILSDIGSVLQLIGIFYVVLTLVVNGEVFGLGRVIGGIPVGTLSIALVGIGFLMSFVFANYNGSIKDSVLDSFKNIVSVLLGVVNVFSDIVSYIRLWAVGLAGAAISATVNELAGPLFGKLTFIVLAIILLVFGHGLNMILNILSVIVHGVRLNTLEFSTHLDMSWSGHKYKPFKE